MDYEKAYKEAFERASNLHKDAIDLEDKHTLKVSEIIFPELMEDEDEKIRKKIVNAIHDYANRLEEKIPSEWLAWLEKQKKEENKNRDEDCKNAYNSGYLDGLSSYQNELDYAYKCADEVQYRRGYEDGVASVLIPATSRKFKAGDKIRSKNGCYHDEVVEVREDGAYKLRDLGELYLPEKEWELDNWRPSGKQMAAFEVMLNSDKNHNWFCDDVRLLMQSLYDDLKLMK